MTSLLPGASHWAAKRLPVPNDLILRSDAKHRVSKDDPVRAPGASFETPRCARLRRTRLGYRRVHVIAFTESMD